MTRQEAMDKIAKLLRTDGRTADEAETAQRLAAALADKHDIDLTQLDREEQERAMTVGQSELGRWERVPAEADYASRIIQQFFDVKCIHVETMWEGTHLLQVGLDHHRVIAGHVFEYLLRTFRQAWNKRRNRFLRRRNDFMYGLFVGLGGRLLAARRARREQADLDVYASRHALEVNIRGRIDAYMTREFPNARDLPVPGNGASLAARAGEAAGRNIEINPAVTAPTARPAGLLA